MPRKEKKMTRFTEEGQMYAFTTENIAGYFPRLDLDGKRVLTVTGSGDHIINSYMFGAEDVTSFDISRHASFLSSLKLTALDSLSFEEFKKFLLRENEKDSGLNSEALDFGIYQKLRKSLDSASTGFWDRVYQENGFNGSSVRESILFNNKFDTNQLKISSNPYLKSEEDFKRAKATFRGKQQKMLTCPAQDLGDLLKGDFDVILLSNIADYANEMFPENSKYLEAFNRKVVKPLITHLSPRGIICLTYIYDTRTQLDVTEDYRSQIDNPNIRGAIFQGNGLEYIEESFKSVIPERKDMTIMLIKSNQEVKNGKI